MLLFQESYNVNSPDGWVAGPYQKGNGVKYTYPNNPHNNMRVLPGNPNSLNPAQQEPYVIYKLNGTAYDINGNPLNSANIPEAHIPTNLFDLNKMPK